MTAAAPRFYIGRLGEPEDNVTTFHRLNDGSMIIMERDVPHEDGGESWTENVPRLHVPRHTEAPRGKAWNTPDPAQEAFAQRLVDLMNAAPGAPWEAHVGLDYVVVMAAGENTENASVRVDSPLLALDLRQRLNGVGEWAEADRG